MLLNVLYKIGIALVANIILFIFNFFILSRSEIKLLFNGQIVTDDYNDYLKSIIGYIVETIGMLTAILYINYSFTILESIFKSILIILLLPIVQILFCLFIDWITKSRFAEFLTVIFILFMILDFLCIGGMAAYLLFHFNLL